MKLVINDDIVESALDDKLITYDYDLEAAIDACHKIAPKIEISYQSLANYTPYLHTKNTIFWRLTRARHGVWELREIR